MKRRRPEQQFDKAVLDHLTWRGVPGLFVAHYPAGGWRSSTEAAIFKSLGVARNPRPAHCLRRAPLLSRA
jgi:hypothetical protein